MQMLKKDLAPFFGSLLLPYNTLFMFLREMGSSLSSPPPIPGCLQEVHNKWGQTQEAGRAVVLRSYFSSSLLPSQVWAASTSAPRQLRQPLVRGGGASAGSQLSIFLKKRFPPFLPQQSHVVELPRCQKTPEQIHTLHGRPYLQPRACVFPPNRGS